MIEIQSLQREKIDIILLVTVFTMVFTLPLLWGLIRALRNWAARRRIVVLPDKQSKRKPDIAIEKSKTTKLTQAEILAQQRIRAKELHGVGDKKLKGKSGKMTKGPPVPKRKEPPKVSST